MYSIHAVPNYIILELNNIQINREEIILAAMGDLSLKNFFNEVWVIVTDKELFILSGTTFNLKKKGKEETSTTWRSSDTNRYKIESMEDIKAEDLITGGRLIAKVDGTMQVLCRYSNSMKREFSILVKNIEKIKDNKEIDENDYKEEQHNRFCPKCGLMYPDQNRKVCPKCINRKSLFLRVLSFASKYKWKVALILFFMFIHAGFNVLAPFVSGQLLFDEILTSGGSLYGKIGLGVFLIFAVRLMSIVTNVIFGRINAYVTGYVIYDIKTLIFQAMQKLSLDFYSNKQTGGLMTRINRDADNLQHFFHHGMPYLIVNIVIIIGTLITMLITNFSLTLLCLIPAPIVLFTSIKIFPILYKKFGRVHRSRRFMNALINDSLTGFRVVKAFGKEREEINRFSKSSNNVMNTELNLVQYIHTMFPLMRTFIALGTIIIWGVGGWQVLIGEMTFGKLLSFLWYLNLIIGPLQYMADITNWMSDSMNSAMRIFEILDATPTIYDQPDASHLEEFKGKIELDNVTFAYEPNKPVIHNICFTIQPGEMIGLVGRSGAGKSTIANLLMRLYDVNEGKIRIDGYDIRDIALADLHKNVSMVMQDTFLFAGTIAENIAYARPEATTLEIINAAKSAYAHEFIMKLPYGYNTIIGKDGQSLSGGEKQRLSIARTILHNPKIIILDEATSAVDTKTEKQIQRAIDRLVEGRTVLSIAHRLSTLNNADKIVVIEDGKLVETGTHRELLEKKGAFYEMYEKQREALKMRGVV